MKERNDNNHLPVTRATVCLFSCLDQIRDRSSRTTSVVGVRMILNFNMTSFFSCKLVCLFHFLYYYAQIRLKVVLVQLCRYTERLGFVFLFPVRQFINKPVSKSRLCCSSLLLNILWGIRLCCQPKLSSCICRTGNRIAAKQLQFQFLVGIAAEEIVRQ